VYYPPIATAYGLTAVAASIAAARTPAATVAVTAAAVRVLSLRIVSPSGRCQRYARTVRYPASAAGAYIVAIGICSLLVAVGCGGSRSAEDVVRAWSQALNAGDNEAAAELFAPGAQIVQGGRTVRLETHEDAVAWNASLPCSGEIVEVETEGDNVTATFLLDDRTTSACDAPGAEATATFEIEDGKIVLWHQLGGEAEETGPAV
jgi:hypothetical protein